MALILSYPNFGNLKIYDAKAVANLKRISYDFQNLKIDPYVKEGFRRKHIARFNYNGETYIQKQNSALFQSSRINPTHGNIQRVYPDFVPSDESDVFSLLQFFSKITDMPLGQNILLQAQRITCEQGKEGLPSVENWHRDGVQKIGILCIDRYNIEGGINEFRKDDDVLSIMMMPGHFVTFQDEDIMHRVTPILSQTYGYRDVMLFAYPDCSI